MLTPTTHKILFSKNLLKIIAVVLGYNLWIFLASFYSISYTTTIPVVIDNPAGLTITDKTSSVTITLKGLRKHIRALDYNKLIARIPQQYVHAGTSTIELTESLLGLPSCISLKMCVPSIISITAEPKILEITIAE